MPDYASILRRSISALPDASPDMRDAVYQRARAALARQLTAVDPPLSSREIQNQHQELEDAVAQLEADYAAAESEHPNLDGPLEPDYLYTEPEKGTALLRPSPPAQITTDDGYGEQRNRRFETDEDEDDEEFEDEEGASRAPLLVGLLLLVLVVVGVVAYAFAERDRLLALFDFSDSGEEVAAVEVADAPSAPDPVAAPETEKRPDRLTNGTEAPPPPPPVAALVEPAPSLALPANEGEAGLVPAEPLSEDSALGLGAEQQTAALNDPGQSLVEQRAIYYFQGAEGTPGQATQGSVTWAEATRDSGPAIQAVLRLEGQEVTATVTIYKNNDPSLPASHLVEVQFSGQIGETPVQRVPALVVKQTEQARGQPLSGAAVPVTNELFWIALSDDQEQVARNLQLLREGSWFDIPILFSDGTRALLTFEKGIPGDRVFETAISAWTAG